MAVKLMRGYYLSYAELPPLRALGSCLTWLHCGVGHVGRGCVVRADDADGRGSAQFLRLHLVCVVSPASALALA